MAGTLVEETMKAKVKLPKSRRGWVFLGLFVAVILPGNWPVVPLFNRNVLLFGLPLMTVWSLVIRDYGARVDYMFPARDFLDAGMRPSPVPTAPLLTTILSSSSTAP